MSDIRDAARRHLIPHFTKAEAWQSPQLPVYVRGDGAYLWDDAGRQVLDGLSGLFCVQIGHGRADLGAVAAKQMETLAFTTNWGVVSPPSIEAAALIAELAPGDLEHVFFVSSGSEAVESAAKLARNYHVARGDEGRYKVVSREWAYHGTTLGALSITAVPRLRAPFLPMLWDGVRNVPNTLHATTKEQGLERVRAIEEKILEEGPDTVALVIAEPVQNGRGALVPPDGYWPELRRICDKYGVLLCADEVINGFGRLGAWFGSELFGVVPDLLTFAKGVTSAYAPLGGVIATNKVVDEIAASPLASFVHGSTFGGHPVATAVAVANLMAMREEGVVENVVAHKDHLANRMRDLHDTYDVVKEVRGMGYFYAVELMGSRAAGRDLTADESAGLLGGELTRFIREAALHIRADDRGATMLAIAPPLICGTDELDDLATRVAQVIEKAAAWLA
ncbi:MAG TPA: aminotransferase class III-fold pyridoxal phosphate-dependent enzyme [Ilumatobacteraceae bacterium]|nr:aminotransferase class III-fold pyridoxal phosphate-dependent enzyme [Ilumatobacteraceae bacterium]